MKKIIWILLFVFLGSCENVQYLDFYPSSVRARVEWKKGPSSTQENNFIVTLWDTHTGSEAKPSLDSHYEFDVQLWMSNCGPSGGHPSSPVKIKKIAGGVFEVSEAYFPMKGLWDVNLKLKKNNQLAIALLYVKVEK